MEKKALSQVTACTIHTGTYTTSYRHVVLITIVCTLPYNSITISHERRLKCLTRFLFLSLNIKVISLDFVWHQSFSVAKHEKIGTLPHSEKHHKLLYLFSASRQYNETVYTDNSTDMMTKSQFRKCCRPNSCSFFLLLSLYVLFSFRGLLLSLVLYEQ